LVASFLAEGKQGTDTSPVL